MTIITRNLMPYYKYRNSTHINHIVCYYQFRINIVLRYEDFEWRKIHGADVRFAISAKLGT